MAKTTYYRPPQESYPYFANDPEVAQTWLIDNDTAGIMYINGVISEADYSGSLTGSSVVYLTAVRTYMPGGTDLAFETTGLRIPVTAAITQREADGISSSQPQFVSGTNQDDIFTVDPYSATTLRFTKNGFLQNTKEMDASGGSDLLKIEDAYASGKYTFSRNESGDIVGIASHLYQGPVVLKNFEYVSFTDTGRRTIESFFETPAEKDSSATSSPSNGDASQTGNTIVNNNDRVMASSESAIIDTGEGIDTVVYKLPASKITKISDGWFVNGNLLKNVERVEFTDKIVALDIDGISGKGYRIYQAAFARTPDNEGLKYWINTMDSGHSLEAVAGGFIASEEFKTLYGDNPSNEAFVTKLYNNVLGRAPEQGGFDYWTGLLNDQKISNVSTLINFSESVENQLNVIGVIENGIELFL